MNSTVNVTNPKPMVAILMIAAFIGLFGETALNMALTDIMADFMVNTVTVQWLTTGYLLVLGILVPISALIIQWMTTRKIVLVAFVFSIVGTILCAIAPNFTFLLIGRLVQAVGTGLILPLMINVILVVFPMSKRGAVMGIMGLVITLAPAIGPTLSGFIVDLLSWHYIFWMSLILYVVLFVIGLPKIQNVSTLTKPKIDYASILLSTVGFGGLIYGLSMIAEASLTERIVFIPLGLGIIALVLFVFRQLNMKEPMMDLAVFKYRNFTLGSILLLIGFAIILSSAILMPLYLKGSLLMTATAAGIAMLAGNILNAVMAPFVGNFFDRVGPRFFLRTGFSLITISNFIMYMTISETTALWIIIVAYMILFLGIAMIIMPAQTNALNELPISLYPHGSAVLNTFQQIAGAAGTALAITLLTSGQKSYAQNFPGSGLETLMAAGTKHVFLFILALSVIGLILAFFVKRASVGAARAGNE